MQQCPKCKCQVGSGISVCPYCGTQLSVEEVPQAPGVEATYIRPQTVFPNAGTYRVTYVPEPPAAPAPAASPVSTELPTRYETSIYYNYPETRKRGVSTETILLALVICMIVASLFQFIALMLLLLR